MDASFERDACLNDGRPVRLRWIRPTDAGLLRDGFARLSPASRYGRFFTSMKELPEGLVQRFTRVDGVDHCAVVAIQPDGQRGLGVARFVRAEEPTSAEVAVTVADDIQGLGLASALLSVLAVAARDRAIDTFLACALLDNGKARRLLRKLGAEHVRTERGTAWYRLPVARLLPTAAAAA